MMHGQKNIKLFNVNKF